VALLLCVHHRHAADVEDKQPDSRGGKNAVRFGRAAPLFQHPLRNLPHARRLFRLLHPFLSNPGQHSSANRLVRGAEKRLQPGGRRGSGYLGSVGFVQQTGVGLHECTEGIQLHLGRLPANLPGSLTERQRRCSVFFTNFLLQRNKTGALLARVSNTTGCNSLKEQVSCTLLCFSLFVPCSARVRRFHLYKRPQVYWFAEEVRWNKIGFSANGLFNIDRQLLFMVNTSSELIVNCNSASLLAGCRLVRHQHGHSDANPRCQHPRRKLEDFRSVTTIYVYNFPSEIPDALFE
jgi:hypothetical protein